MPKKTDFLRVIDQETPVTGGGGLIQQQVQVAPPVPGTIPAPTNLTSTATGIARSSQAPMAFVDLAWNAPGRITPEYYIIEYTKTTFDQAVRLRANELTARVLVDTSSTYYFRVQAVYRTSSSDWSNTLTVNTPSDLTAPTDVSGVVATFVNGDVIITWNEPPTTDETYKDARIRIWNSGKTILYGTYHVRGGSLIWTESENMRLSSGGVTTVAVDVTSRGWNNVYGTPQNATAGLGAPSAPTSFAADFTTGDLVITWTPPAGVRYRDFEVKLYESSSKVTNYKTYYTSANTVTFTKEENFIATANNPDTSIYIEIKTRGWLGLISSALTGTATHTALAPVTSVNATFVAGDLLVTWTNPNVPYKDIEVKIYESSSKVTNYKTYYLMGNSIIFSQADNYAINGSTPDTNLYVEVKTRTWLGLLSTAASDTAALTAPNPVTSVVTDFTTGDLDITWTNPTNAPYRDVEVKIWNSSAKTALYKTYYLNGNKVTFTAEDNFTAVGTGSADWEVYYEITVRSWLGVVSTTVTGTATHTAPSPVTSVVTDFSTGDLEISWTNPGGVYKYIRVRIYNSSAATVLYKTYTILTNRVKFTVEDNFAVTGNNPDPSVYYVIDVISRLELNSTSVTGTVTKALPANPANVVHTWTGDDGTFPADIRMTWDAVPHVKSYIISIDSWDYETTDTLFEYTYVKNVADHIGTTNFGDPSFNFAISAKDRLNQISTGATNNVAANAAPPGSTVISITTVAGFSTIGAFVTLTKPIKDLDYFIYELHNGTSVVQTLKTSSQVISFEGVASGTYTVRVKGVDKFNQTGATVTSSSLTIDALTIDELRAEAKYTDSQGRTSPALDILKDDLNGSTVNYNHTNAGQYGWTLLTRPLVDRYGVVTYISPDSTEIYIGFSLDNVTYTWFATPATNKGSNRYILTQYTNETDARGNRLVLAGNIRYSFQLPEMVDARYIKLVHRSNNAGNYLISEFYARRLLQSDDIQAESIIGINIAASTITGDRIFGTELSSVKSQTGQLVINTGGHIRSGQTAYDTGTGYFLGTDGSGIGLFSLGAIDRKLTWDGANLYLVGSFIIRTATSAQKVEITGTGLKGYNSSGVVQVQIDTADGKLKAAGGAVVLDSTGVSISSGGNIRSGQTAYDTGVGFYIGNDSTTPRISIGNSSGTKFLWDGSAMTIQGSGLTIRTAASNQRVELTSAGLKGYNSSNVEQVALSSADGKLTAGAGNVILDANGMSLKAATVYGETNSIKFYDGSNVKFMDFYAEAPAGSRKTYIITTSASLPASMQINVIGTSADFDLVVAAGGFQSTMDVGSSFINFGTDSMQLNAPVVIGSLTTVGMSDGELKVQNGIYALNGVNVGSGMSGAASGEVLAQHLMIKTVNSNKVTLVDSNTYSNGTNRSVDILFKSKNADSVDTHTSAAISVTLTADTGITIPRSMISFYTKDNTAGYGERLRIGTDGTLYHFGKAQFGNSSTSLVSGAVVNIGNSTTDYPASSGWNTTFNANLVLHGLNYSSIGFHDASHSVGVIRYSGGWFEIGPNVGWTVNTVIHGSLAVQRDSSTRIGYITIPLTTPAKDTGSWDGQAKNIVGYTAIDLQNASTFNLPASIKGVFVRFAAKPAAVTAGGFIALSADSTNDIVVLWATSTTDYQEATAFIPTNSGDIYYRVVGTNWSQVYLYIFGYVI